MGLIVYAIGLPLSGFFSSGETNNVRPLAEQCATHCSIWNLADIVYHIGRTLERHWQMVIRQETSHILRTLLTHLARNLSDVELAKMMGTTSIFAAGGTG